MKFDFGHHCIYVQPLGHLDPFAQRHLQQKNKLKIYDYTLLMRMIVDLSIMERLMSAK